MDVNVVKVTKNNLFSMNRNLSSHSDKKQRNFVNNYFSKLKESVLLGVPILICYIFYLTKKINSMVDKEKG